MEPSDRRQSDVLPALAYVDFERAARDGAQYHQRHPPARNSISSASPISPTTQYGPSANAPGYSQQSQQHPPQASNGMHTPPDSGRTSNECRQSLPSLHEALYDKSGGTFTAPSPLQTPPIGSGSFSAPPPLSTQRNNSISNSMPNSMQQGQSSDPRMMMQSHQPNQLEYAPSQPPHPSTTAAPPPPPPHPSTLSQDSSYIRHDSQSHGRPIPPSHYPQTQPPPPPPPVPQLHTTETSYQQPPPPPPPPPPQSLHHSVHSSHYQPHSQYPPHTSSSPHYPPPAPAYSNGTTAPPAPPPPSSMHYPPYQTPQQHPHAPASHQSVTPAHSHHAPPYQPQHAAQPGFSYPVRDPGSGYPLEPCPPPPKQGVKRGSGYGSAIEKALSLSAIRRDMDYIKEHSARIYHIVAQYQEFSQSGQHPAGVHASLLEFNEALQRSYRNTEALTNCQQVFADLSAKEAADQNIHNMKMSVTHTPDYGTDDGHSYVDDNRSNGSQQPEKKMRRGRAAPPGRCHSCQRAETPEWRRGPDGARTLCNACGLHYAKLTRKLSKNTMESAAMGRKPNSPR